MKLPSTLEAATIARMVTGDVGYTTPWAMWVDDDRNCWLYPRYTLRSQPGGTVQMRVELRVDGYYVTPPEGYTWTPQSEPAFVGGNGIEYLPVAGMVS
jgi:hypothetical protein